MNVLRLQPGKYVIALSGGIDSVALTDILSKQEDTTLILAHYNHGIRNDSYKDEELVRKLAISYELPLEVAYGQLGPSASEELARQKRYEFLLGVTNKYNATGLVTAHHQDDLLETAIINMLRGTGYRGLTAILMNPDVLRPLTRVPKSEIIKYAKQHRLRWVEDQTNSDTKYQRNYIRKNIMPKVGNKQRQQILKILEKVAKNQKEIEGLLRDNTVASSNLINRNSFTHMPFSVGSELVINRLRLLSQTDYNKETIERLNLAIRTARDNTTHPVNKNLRLEVQKKHALLVKTL